MALAVQIINKIKANHPILFRLRLATVSYLIKNSTILFKMKGERIYSEDKRVDQAVYILLYGRCKLKKSSKTLGIKMGIGYVFNEESLFPHENPDHSRSQHLESLISTEESALLRVDNQIFSDMIDLSSARNRGASPHMMEDQDLLWELFERHHFVKSAIRINANLIGDMP